MAMSRITSALAMLVRMIVYFVLPVLVISAILPSIVSRDTPKPHRCANNLRQIALAIWTYESENGGFPPPYTMDAAGTPLLSWRVLILPYLGYEGLFQRVHLDRPWNHPDNMALANGMPEIFRCPRTRVDDQLALSTTPYVAIIGEETAWPRGGQRKRSDITDGMVRTLSVIQSEPSRLPWMAPHDPSIEAIGTSRNGATSIIPRGYSATALFCDGHCSYIEDPDGQTLRAACTAAGGEEVDLPGHTESR